MSTSYADSAQARLMDDRMTGSSVSGAQDNWFDDGPDIFSQRCKEAEAKRLAAWPGRLRIAMAQVESVLAIQGERLQQEHETKIAAKQGVRYDDFTG